MYSAPDPKVHVKHDDQVFRLIVRGEVDYEDAEDFEAAWQAADQAALLTTVVDLSQVTFADSMLLNALLDARRRHDTHGRRFILLGPLQPAVSRLLDLSGTREHFTVEDSDMRT